MNSRQSKLTNYDILGDEQLVGTAVTYVVYAGTSRPALHAFQGDYLIDAFSATRPGQVRARRSQSKGGRARADHGLSNVIAVLFGPDVSPRAALSGLKALMARIEKDGLLIGRDKRDNYQMERLRGVRCAR